MSQHARLPDACPGDHFRAVLSMERAGGFHPDQGVLNGWAAVVACEVEAGPRQGGDGEVDGVVPLFPADATRRIADAAIVFGVTIAALSLWALS